MKKRPPSSKLDRAARLLLKMGPVPHEKVKDPTKADLRRRFKLRSDRKGNPKIEET